MDLGMNEMPRGEPSPTSVPLRTFQIPTSDLKKIFLGYNFILNLSKFISAFVALTCSSVMVAKSILSHDD